MPAWVDSAWSDYSRRFPPHLPLNLKEVAPPGRYRNVHIEDMRRREGESLLAAVPASSLVVALDVKGAQWTTSELSGKLESWMQEGRDVAFLIGGPDGLARSCLDRADLRWSLGKLTFPHALVRVVLAEQLYRAWSMTQNHPYHRA